MAIAALGIFSLSGTRTVATGLERTANGGKIWANLRARATMGIQVLSHLYIEFVDREKNIRVIFEGMPTPYNPLPNGALPGGLVLNGMVPRPWGHAYQQGEDSDAVNLPDESIAHEAEDDDYSPLMGVQSNTYQCLLNARLQYQAHRVRYKASSSSGEFGHNSNWYAVNLCRACGLTYPAGLPGWLAGSRCGCGRNLSTVMMTMGAHKTQRQAVVTCTIVNLLIFAIELTTYLGRNTATVKSIYSHALWEAENYGIIVGGFLSIIGIWIRQPSRMLRMLNAIILAMWIIFVCGVLGWHLLLDHLPSP